MKILFIVAALLATPQLTRHADARRPTLVFDDPSGDDAGPGDYLYPTDPVFVPGTFDLQQLTLQRRGANVEIRLRFAAPVTDPWDSRAWGGQGFSLLHAQVYVDTREGGSKQALGVDAEFEGAGWDRVVLISAESPRRLKEAIRTLPRAMRRRVLLPKKLSVEDRTIVATVSARSLGRPSPGWRAQVLIGSTDPTAPAAVFHVRAVNERAGAFVFGGGSDVAECDPHVLDVLTPPGVSQGDVLAYRCCPEGDKRAGCVARLPFVSPRADR